MVVKIHYFYKFFQNSFISDENTNIRQGDLGYCIANNVGKYGSDRLLLWLIDSPNIYEASLDYIKYRQFGIIFVCFNFLYRALYVGISNTKVITYSTVIMAAVNIGLDYCLIFGNCGFPQMGIAGAALASFCAEVSAFIFFTSYSYITLRKRDFGMFKIHRPETELMGRILKISTPTMIQKLFSFSVWFIFFVLIEKMGETATGNTSAALYLETAILVVYIFFILMMTRLTTRVELVWTAEILYGALLGILCSLYMKFAKWDKKRI